MATLWEADFGKHDRLPLRAIILLYLQRDVTTGVKLDRKGRPKEVWIRKAAKTTPLRDDSLVTGPTITRLKHHVLSPMDRAAFGSHRDMVAVHSYTRQLINPVQARV